jgi:SH3 domain-containing YSC84-like protein 1
MSFQFCRFKKEVWMRFLIPGLVVALAFTAVAFAELDDKVADRLFESAKIIEELINAPDGGIPADLLKKAECVAAIPAVKKAAFGIGGNYGRGAVACRKDQGKGPWGPPSMLVLGGGSFGFQIGGQSTDVVMLFMTADSIKYLLRDKVTLGGDASAAIGPKGREASAETSASMRAEILTYARSRGAFAGVSLKGAVLSPDKDANKNLYKKSVDAKDLLMQGDLSVPDSGRRFVDNLTKFASK